MLKIHPTRFAVVLASCLLTAGCGTIQNAFSGEPRINDHAWLLTPPFEDGRTLSPDDTGYLPPPCVPGSVMASDARPDASAAAFAAEASNAARIGKTAAPASTVIAPVPANPAVLDPYAGWTTLQINTCTHAMIQLVDLKFAHYEDALVAANSSLDSFVDVSVIGLGAAGSLAGGPTAQILSAASSALTGTLGKLNNDVLYAKTMDVVLQQMRTSRSAQAIVIDAKLNAKPGAGYANMYEAANDVYKYARAGSWTEAFVSLQASAGAQSQACTVRQAQTEIASAQSGTTGAGTGTAPAAAPAAAPIVKAKPNKARPNTTAGAGGTGASNTGTASVSNTGASNSTPVTGAEVQCPAGKKT